MSAPGVYIMRDAADAVLYVGVSINTAIRFAQHSDRPWWQDVATVSIRHAATRDEAFTLEKHLIAELRPKHNVQGTAPKATRPSKPRPRVTPPAAPLWAVREAVNLTRAELAELTNGAVSEELLGDIEDGAVECDAETLDAIKAALFRNGETKKKGAAA